MKRTYSMLRFAAVLLCGVLAACSGDLLEAEEPAQNPYHQDAEALFTGLVDHTITYVQGYHGPRTDPGLVLLEAIDAYAPLAIDFDVDEMAAAYLNANATDRKAPRARPFDGDDSLAPNQKRHLNRLLDRASRAVSLPHLRTILNDVEATASNELGPEATQPIYIVSAFLQAQLAYVSDEANQPKLRRMALLLNQMGGSAPSSGPRIISVQTGDSLDAPPNWNQHFRPGEFIRQTVSDVSNWAQTGAVLVGGVGCAMGLAGATFGCAAGGAGGALLGGAIAGVVGIFVSTAANLIDEVRDLQAANAAWCEEQSRLNAALRHREYQSKCVKDQQ